MEFAQFIDQSILAPFSSPTDIKKLCHEALTHHFAGVCIPPYFAKEAKNILGEDQVKLVTVAGFPYGYSNVSSKIEEIKKAIDDGVDEVDAMLNHCAVKSGQWNFVKNEIESLLTMCHMKGKILKLIVEMRQLSSEELSRICALPPISEVDFISTSAGIYNHPVSTEEVAQLRSLLPSEVKIKVSGEIQDKNFVAELIQAGVSRIGTSFGVQLVH